MILGIPGNGMVDISTEGNLSKYQIILKSIFRNFKYFIW